MQYKGLFESCKDQEQHDLDFTRPVFNKMDYRFFMPEIQHTEYISAATRALEAAAQSCHGAEDGSSALLMDADLLRYLHRAGVAEHKHILNAPDGSISPVTVVGALRLIRHKSRRDRNLLTDVQSSANPWGALMMLLSLS